MSNPASDMTPIWAWMTQESDGRWTAIRADIPDLGMTRLVAGFLSKAESMRHHAERHRQLTGKPVRLVRYDAPTILQILV